MTGTGAICPFCAAPWTAAMLDQYDRHSHASSCSCCGDMQHSTDEPTQPEAAQDISCEACGRAIFRAMPAMAAGSLLG
ncbi:MAG: hypothetical protein R3E02_10995 [Blastomonas sp.]